MKSILYVGAALMIGAGIYGFVDQEKSASSKGFREMYSKENEAPRTEPVTTSEIIPAKTQELKPVVEVAKVGAPAKTETKFAEAKAVKKTKASKFKKAGKKKLNYKSFSRGRIDK